MMSLLSDKNKANNEAKVLDLYNRYKGYMLKIAYNILLNMDLAEEVVHESFLAIIKNIDKISSVDDTKTKNYIIVITRNNALKLREKVQKEKVRFVDIDEQFDVSCDFNLEDEVTSNDNEKVIYDKIKMLPVKYRDLLLLKYQDDLSYKEISDILGINQPLCRKRMQTAKKLLIKILKECDLVE